MARPKGAKDLTPAERERILELRRLGLRYTEIARIVRRGLVTIQRALRGTGLNVKSSPRPRKTKRDARIAHLILAKGWSGARVGRLYGMSASWAYEIARTAALGYSKRQRRLEQKRRAKE